MKKEEIEHIANLARLELTETEKEKFSHHLDTILDYVEKLNELDTSKIPITSCGISLQNVFRNDDIKKSLSSKDVLQNAPSSKDNFFKVPKII